jgi:hypothetical protein
MKNGAGIILILVALVLGLFGTVLYWEITGYPTLGHELKKTAR